MAEVGRTCLYLALAVAGYGIFASLYGVWLRRRDPVKSAAYIVSGRRSVYAVAALSTAAFGILEAAFLRSDFSYSLVSSHSSSTTPTFYKGAAAWSSQEGSLLLWLWLLSLWSSLVLFLSRRRLRIVAPWATAVLLGYALFFAALLVFLESPFEENVVTPVEGNGLMPLLRHPGMMIHPPMLYSGYTLFTIPFAFAIGALITRQVGNEWIAQTRRFALAAWLFLGIGVLLGARWSYGELGWGGYWGWDPVENASLMPWLTGTAFLHSIMIQEKRGMLKVWNMSLILATGILAIVGTFLVRSGILDSIHAFGASTLGVPFVVLLGVMIASSVGLVVWRREALRSEHKLDSALSREAIFLGNNVVLVAMCFFVFWGTFWPLIAEAFTGDRGAIGQPFFENWLTPMALVLVLLSGIGPVIAWRKATVSNARRNFLWPGGLALLVGAGLATQGIAERPLGLLMFIFGSFVCFSVGQETARGWRARRAMSDDGPLRALSSLIGRNRRRYGGYVVHVGMALLFIGVAASSAFKQAEDNRIQVGETISVGNYDVKYLAATGDITKTSGGDLERINFGAVVRVTKDGDYVATLRPERGYYPSQDERGLGAVGRFFEGDATSEIGLKAGMQRDIWTAMTPSIDQLTPIIERGDQVFADAEGKLTPEARAEFLATTLVGLVDRYKENPPPATFRVIDSPMVTWIWLGAIICFLGGLIGLWPSPDAARRRSRAGYAVRVAEDLGRA